MIRDEQASLARAVRLEALNSREVAWRQENAAGRFSGSPSRRTGRGINGERARAALGQAACQNRANPRGYPHKSGLGSPLARGASCVQVGSARGEPLARGPLSIRVRCPYRCDSGGSGGWRNMGAGISRDPAPETLGAGHRPRSLVPRWAAQAWGSTVQAASWMMPSPASRSIRL